MSDQLQTSGPLQESEPVSSGDLPASGAEDEAASSEQPGGEQADTPAADDRSSPLTMADINPPKEEDAAPPPEDRAGANVAVAEDPGERPDEAPVDETSGATSNSAGGDTDEPPVPAEAPVELSPAEAREKRFSNLFAVPHHQARSAAHDQAMQIMKGFFGVRKGIPSALNAFGLAALELECGPAFRLHNMTTYGWRVAGTESSVCAYQYASGQLLGVVHGQPHEASFGRDRFDLVFCVEDFCALSDPELAALRCSDLVTQRGLVCLHGQPVECGDTLVDLFEAAGFEHADASESADRLTLWFERRG